MTPYSILSFGMPGPLEMGIIAAVLVLLFGANKIPQLGAGIGEGIRNFKHAIKGDEGAKNTTAIQETENRC